MPLLPECLNCGRALSDPESMRNGFGPECHAKIQSQQAMIDAGRHALNAGFDDAKLRVISLVLKRRESALLLYDADTPAPVLAIALVRAIRKELAARVELLIRKGYLPPVSDEFVPTGHGTTGRAPASEMAHG